MKRLAEIILAALVLVSGGWRHGSVFVPPPTPILSAQTASTDGNDHAFLSVTTNIGSGTLYWDGSVTCGLSPTAAAIKAGSVSGHVVNGNQAVSGTGIQSVNPGSLSPVTAYCFYLVQTAASDSNIVGTTTFTTNGTIAITVSRTAAYLANPNVAAFDTVAASVNTEIINCFAPPTNITIFEELDYGVVSGAAVTSVQPSNNNYANSGGPIRNALIALPGKNSVQTALFASPPVSDPTGISDIYYVTNAQSLGIGQPRFGGTPDWSTKFDSGHTWDTTTNCSGAGTCLASVSEHEFTEGLGRKSGIDSGSSVGLMEFSSYSSAGNRNVAVNGSSRYPSSNGGGVNLISPWTYNQSGGGDDGDWTDGIGTDSFTNNVSGAKPPMSAQDIISMTVMGWPLTHSCRITAGL